MSRIFEPTAEQEAEWKKWVESRPKIVRKVAERFDPWSLYRMGKTGQRVTIAAFSEDGTVRVNVSGEHNFTLFERSVFGVNPDDLTPCDPPTANELTGAMLTPQEVDENIDVLRDMAGIKPAKP